MASSLIIEFDHIGRTHNPPPLRVAMNRGPEYIEKEVHRYAGKYLMSREYDVYCDLAPIHPGETGNVYIDGGRFGKGKITVEELVDA